MQTRVDGETVEFKLNSYSPKRKFQPETIDITLIDVPEGVTEHAARRAAEDKVRDERGKSAAERKSEHKASYL